MTSIACPYFVMTAPPILGRGFRRFLRPAAGGATGLLFVVVLPRLTRPPNYPQDGATFRIASLWVAGLDTGFGNGHELTPLNSSFRSHTESARAATSFRFLRSTGLNGADRVRVHPRRTHKAEPVPPPRSATDRRVPRLSLLGAGYPRPAAAGACTRLARWRQRVTYFVWCTPFWLPTVIARWSGLTDCRIKLRRHGFLRLVMICGYPLQTALLRATTLFECRGASQAHQDGLHWIRSTRAFEVNGLEHALGLKAFSNGRPPFASPIPCTSGGSILLVDYSAIAQGMDDPIDRCRCLAPPAGPRIIGFEGIHSRRVMRSTSFPGARNSHVIAAILENATSPRIAASNDKIISFAGGI